MVPTERKNERKNKREGGTEGGRNAGKRARIKDEGGRESKKEMS